MFGCVECSEGSSHLGMCTRPFLPLKAGCLQDIHFAVYHIEYVRTASASRGVVRPIASSTVRLMGDRLVLTPAMQQTFLSSAVHKFGLLLTHLVFLHSINFEAFM